MSVLRSSRWFPSMMSACLITSLCFAVGCAHTLEVKNMGLYKPEFISTDGQNIKIGLSTNSATPEENRLVMAVANAMKRDGLQVTYPFFPNEESLKTVDYTIRLSTTSEYKGSGANFLINWPGFLVWAPAWHGYKYSVTYGFDADITDAHSGATLPRISAPVALDIRHADMGRTWTELSWFEWSAIAFIGGLLFTRYDHDITPQLLDATENKIGDYVASKIAAALKSAKASTAQEKLRWKLALLF